MPPSIPPPDAGWIKILDSQGLGVVIVLVGVFVFVPAIGLVVWKAMGWFSSRADKLIDAHLSFLTTTSATLQMGAEVDDKIMEAQSHVVETQTAIKELIAGNQGPLSEIREGVAVVQSGIVSVEKSVGNLHEKVDALAKAVSPPIQKG